MLKNYFKIAVRNLARHKLFSGINIFGLALSMSICLLVILHVKEQLGYDKFHPLADRIYRVTTTVTSQQGSVYRMASSPLPLASRLEENYPFVEAVAGLYPAGNLRASAANRQLGLKAVFTGPSFFRVFGFKLAAGDAETILAAPNTLVLTQEAAAKFFGSSDPLGKTLETAFGAFLVGGVLQPSPGNSHLDFEAYLSLSSLPPLEKAGLLPPALQQWNLQAAAYNYVLLKDGAKAAQLQTALSGIVKDLLAGSTLRGKEAFAFGAQPFNSIILGEELGNSLGAVGSRSKLAAEVGVGFIILLSACFNYTNLSIARSLNRGKEVGIRKVAGAARYQVFGQFVFESVLIALLALGGAYLLLRLMVAYAPFIGDMGRPDLSFDGTVLAAFLFFAIFTGLLAGTLPAWILSAFKPVTVLKNLATVKLFGGQGFRKTLIVIQFVLAVVITVFTGIASRQFHFIATADTGYNREHLLAVPLDGARYQLLRDELEKVAGVKTVAATSVMPGRDPSGHSLLWAAPGSQPLRVDYYDVDRGFLAAFDLQLVAGTGFPPHAGEAPETHVLLNEKAISVLPFRTPADAVGKQVRLDDSTYVQIAGVVKDFYYQGLAATPGALMLRYRPSAFRFLVARTAGRDPRVVDAIGHTWKSLSQQPFQSSWFKDDLYERQGAWGTVSMLGFLAFMSVTIACLGLLGMVIYTTETRRKEIGIRKVMGASGTAIARLLSGSFIKLVCIAGAIALPVSCLLGFFFLQMFASRVSIDVPHVVLPFFGLLFLALLTIGSQVLRLAAANPVKSLRTE